MVELSAQDAQEIAEADDEAAQREQKRLDLATAAARFSEVEKAWRKLKERAKKAAEDAQRTIGVAKEKAKKAHLAQAAAHETYRQAALARGALRAEFVPRPLIEAESAAGVRVRQLQALLDRQERDHKAANDSVARAKELDTRREDRQRIKARASAAAQSVAQTLREIDAALIAQDTARAAVDAAHDEASKT